MRTTLHSTTLTPTNTFVHRSPWHSPVSYLFGGLAAMTGLIAFALLILACSYCQLSRASDDDSRRREGDDVEQGKTGEGGIKVSPVFEEKFLVIMAGHDIPTFVATPMFSKADLIAPVKAETEVKGDEERRDEKPKEEEGQVGGHDQEEGGEETGTEEGDRMSQ